MENFAHTAATILFLLTGNGPAGTYDWRSHYATETPYRVVNVANPDGLDLRSGPSPRTRVTGTLDPRAYGVYIRTCSRHARWCLVDGEGQSGWANMRYLAGYVE